MRFWIFDFRFRAACGSPRTAERPVSETVSLGGAIPLTPTNFYKSPIANRESRKAHVVQCRDGALKTRKVSVQIRPWAPTACSPIRRDVPLKTERLQVRGLPRGPIWNVHRSSEPGLGANECVPYGKWCKSTAFRHSCARSSKRAGGFIPRIALDQCRDPERYRTRVPLCAHSSKHRAGVS